MTPVKFNPNKKTAPARWNGLLDFLQIFAPIPCAGIIQIRFKGFNLSFAANSKHSHGIFQ
jgi:hypothetical protein